MTRLNLAESKSAGELDVVWEHYSENIHIKRLLEDYYNRRRARLVQAGKIEPEQPKKLL